MINSVLTREVRKQYIEDRGYIEVYRPKELKQLNDGELKSLLRDFEEGWYLVRKATKGHKPHVTGRIPIKGSSQPLDAIIWYGFYMVAEQHLKEIGVRYFSPFVEKGNWKYRVDDERDLPQILRLISQHEQVEPITFIEGMTYAFDDVSISGAYTSLFDAIEGEMLRHELLADYVTNRVTNFRPTHVPMYPAPLDAANGIYGIFTQDGSLVATTVGSRDTRLGAARDDAHLMSRAHQMLAFIERVANDAAGPLKREEAKLLLDQIVGG